jgi:fatty-acid peroxygenase
MTSAERRPVSRRSPALLRDGYEFWSRLRGQQGSEVVRTRLAGRPVTGIYGADAAKFFYEEPSLERWSALPTFLTGPLFGKGAVHSLDGAQHAHRKAMFNGMLTAEAVNRVSAGVAHRWDERSSRWHGTVDLFTEASIVLFEEGCEWIGLPGHGSDGRGHAADLLAMVDGFGSPGWRHWRARAARRRTDDWVQGLVQEIRDGAPASSAVGVVALHRDEHGELLPVHTAAVEVINLLRPLVAVSWLINGATLALDSWLELRSQVGATFSSTDFAQEVRRCYPFVPCLVARATTDLEWAGARIPRGTLVVIDVWGTNHDARVWTRPNRFDPTRFVETPVTPYNLIPQGGGDRHHGHRCPGEDMTLGVLTTLIPRLASTPLHVEGPRPDLRRMPPAPTCRVAVRP